MPLAVLHPRSRSLLRGTLLVLAAVPCALLISDFPHNRATLLLVLPLLAAIYGTWETIRCLRPRWSFYHGAVMLLLYMDVMALAILFFLLLYPYFSWLL